MQILFVYKITGMMFVDINVYNNRIIFDKQLNQQFKLVSHSTYCTVCGIGAPRP